MDIAIYGPAWRDPEAAQAKDLLEEIFFPWSFNVVLPEAVSNNELIDHIERVGFEISLGIRNAKTEP